MPARLSWNLHGRAGFLFTLALVAQLDGALAVEFAWETVDRIMRGKMEFSSL